MPQRKLLLNLGTHDARALGLDPKAATAGAVVDVEDEAAAELDRRGWGVDPELEAEGEPLAPTAAPSSSATPKIGEADTREQPAAAAPAGAGARPAAAPDLRAMTKAELEQYALDHGIEGVTPAMSKDEQVATIRKHERAERRG